MEIEYDLTPEDLLAYQRYHRQNPPEPRRGSRLTGAFVWVFVGMLAVSALLVTVGADNRVATSYLLAVPYVGLGAVLGIAGILLYVRLMQSRLLMRTLKQGRNEEKFLGWRRLSIDAEGIRSTSEFSSSVYLWHGIDRMGSTPDHAFFYINTTMAVIVPRAAFRDDAAFKAFVDTARRFYRIGRVGGGPGVDADDPAIPTVLPVEEGITPKDVRRSFRDGPGA